MQKYKGVHTLSTSKYFCTSNKSAHYVCHIHFFIICQVSCLLQNPKRTGSVDYIYLLALEEPCWDQTYHSCFLLYSPEENRKSKCEYIM